MNDPTNVTSETNATNTIDTTIATHATKATATHAQPMEMLSAFLPFNILRKHTNNPKQMAALIFGVAGFLQKDFLDEYPKDLKKEFAYLQHKYQLKIMGKSLWKFLRLRPASFPTIRLAQLVAILSKYQTLFSVILEAKSVKQLKNIFAIIPDIYWNTHYTFDNLSVKRNKKIGDKTLDIIIINAIIPMLYLYGKKDVKIRQKATQFLSEIKAEQNYITKKFKQLELPLKSAKQSQAVIQLYNNYCSAKKCINCRLGKYILSNA